MNVPTAFWRFLPAVLSVAILLAATLVHGARTDRWWEDPALEHAGEALSRLPREDGEWVGKDFELDARQLRVGNIAGYVGRTYTHRVSDRTVSVLITYGKPSAIGAHTPDVCYPGTGFQMVSAPKPFALKDGVVAADCQAIRVTKEQPVPQAISVLWAWSPDLLRWESPQYPRAYFALSPVLYKAYFVRPVGQRPGGEDDDEEANALCLRLLRSLRPSSPATGRPATE